MNLGTSHKGKSLFSVSKISKVKNSAKTVNINQFEKIHPATIKISNPGGIKKFALSGADSEIAKNLSPTLEI